MAVRAIIVGVETYGEPDMKVVSPCANAVAMATWLLDNQIAAPADIHVLLAPAEGDPGAPLRARGVAVSDADERTFDTLIRGQLTRNCPTGSHLFFYWSGHGTVDTWGDRILFCGDYSHAFNNRVVNADLFLRFLCLPDYNCFDDTLALIDVCGTWTDYPITPPVYHPGVPAPRTQLVYYAAPEGQEALASTEIGSFSFSALRALQAGGGWPDFEQFSATLDTELTALDIPRLRVWRGTGTDQQPLTYGRDLQGVGGVLEDLVKLIHAGRIPATPINRHYNAVMYAVNNFKLADAQSLAERVAALSKLEDPYKPITGGLIEFVLRLAGEPGGPKLTEWLEENADFDALSAQRDKLERERAVLLLIVEIHVDEQGRFVNLKPSLRDRDNRLVQGQTFPDEEVGSWRQIEESFAALLAKLQRLDLVRNLEVHIVIEAHCFDRAFHQLPGITPERTLGEEFVVVVHHMHRLFRQSDDDREKWRSQADILARCASEHRVWQELPDRGAIPDETALWFAGFPLPIADGPNQAKRRLDTLARLGNPFIYWAHESVEPGTADTLVSLIRDPKTLKGLPSEFKRQRLRGEPVALGGTLLWDDPDFDPFTNAEGVMRP